MQTTIIRIKVQILQLALTQGKKLLPGGVARIPRTQRGSRLVRKQHEILRVVKNGLRPVLLFA